METNERDNMMADLYVLDEYYEKKGLYDAFLNKANAFCRAAPNSTRVKMSIAGNDVFVSGIKDIKEAYAKYGDKFGDGFLELKEPKIPESIKGYSPVYRKDWLILLGSIFVAAAIMALIPLLIFGTTTSPIFIVLIPLIIFTFFIGIAPVAYGLYNLKALKKMDKAYAKHEKDLENYRERKRKSYAMRIRFVEEVYKKEYEESVRLYNLGVEKAKEKWLIQTNEIKDKVKAIETIKENSLSVIQNSIIPSYYLQNPQAVRKMLFLVLNKRADTVKELVNTYETEKWQEQVLAQLGVYCKTMAIQSQHQIEALIAINERLAALHYDITHLEFTSFGVAF